MFRSFPGSRANQGDATPRHRLQPLVFLLVVLGVVIAAAIWLSSVADRDERRIPVLRPPPIDIETETNPWDPAVETWGRIDDATPRGRKEVPMQALAVAAERVARHRWELFVTASTKLRPDTRGFTRVDVPEVMEKHRGLRGQPFSVVGELVRLEPVDVFDLYGGLKLPGDLTATWEGVVRPRADLHGDDAPVRFLMVDPYEPEVRVGEPVKLQGVFFKLQEVEIDGADVTGLFLLGKRLFKSFEVPTADEIDLATLDGVVDPASPAVRSLPFDEPAFWNLAADVIHRPDRDRGVPVDVGGRRVQDLFTRPADFRGEPVTFQARVLSAREVPLSLYFGRNEPGDALIDRVWVTYLTTDGALPLTVFWFEEPDLDLAASDQVRVDGVFYRLWIYESKGPGGFTRAPLLLGIGSPEKLVIGQDPSTHRIAVGLLIFAALSVLLMTVVLRRDRRRSESFRRGMAARRRLNRARS